MKRSIYARFSSIVLVFALLSPLATVAYADGKKNFKRGMAHEAAEEWDKAAEAFALAVSESPKNPEYRLHLTRALFNASQMFMKKGRIAANEKDYQGGYAAFRRAYAFDPTNELAKAEMDRMVRLQKEASGIIDDKKPDANGGVKLVQTSMTTPGRPGTTGAPQIPQKLEKLRDIPFPAGVDLEFLIKELARDLELNVLFDVESFRSARRTKIDLKNVTAAKALDYLFLQEGLFFQKVGPRTILVANSTRRTQYQQLVLRTFYLANAAPKDVAKHVQSAIPPQPGRSQTIVLTDDATNSITVRDTSENIRLIGKLIQSLDKDRAEVVMDVAIYEVNKNDLLQFGNQIGSEAQLSNLGGSAQAAVGIGPTIMNTVTNIAGTSALPLGVPTAVLLPAMNFTAFSKKDDTKLVASTQIHAFNNEDSSARIGQRVPVQSAQFVGVGATTPGSNGVVSNVINYEQVGLTLKFKPLVFPNQDVQVAMEIESKDVAGLKTLTPTFIERTIKGTARIQNNKTLLLASVATGVESHGKQGLPLVGLIPILGRLFTSPTRDNRAIDIVIAVTPRVIRAPSILPDDEIERDTGSIAQPTTNSLEAMIIDEEIQENIAAARRIPTDTVVQLPDQKTEPTYVKTETSGNGAGATDSSAVNTAGPTGASTTAAVPAATAAAADTTNGDAAPKLRPIDTSAKTLQLNQTADTSGAPAATPEIKTLPPEPEASAPTGSPSVEVRLGDLPEMKAGEKVKVPVLIQGTGTFRSAVIGLKFDDKKLAIRSVSFGDVFGTGANTPAAPFLNQDGKMYVSLTAAYGKDMNVAGTLAFIEIEALTPGRPEIKVDADVMNFLTGDGKIFAVKYL